MRGGAGELMAALSVRGSANGMREVIKEKRLMCGSPSVGRRGMPAPPRCLIYHHLLSGRLGVKDKQNNPLHLSPPLTLSLVPFSYLLSFSFISTFRAHFPDPSLRALGPSGGLSSLPPVPRPRTSSDVSCVQSHWDGMRATALNTA